MPQVLVTEQYLEDIADSIRAKNGSANTYTPAQMADAIDSFYPEPLGSISITNNGVYNVKNKEYVNVSVNSGSAGSSNDILYHFDGDLKNYGKADAVFYNVKGFSISDEQSKFGNYSLKCGTTQTKNNIYLLNDFSFGTDDFTLDFWVYGLALNSDTASIPVAFTYRSVAFYLYPNKINVAIGSSNGDSWALDKSESVSIPNDQWIHIAATRNNGYMHFFLNGVRLTTLEYNIGSNAMAPVTTITLGSNSSDGERRFQGYISEFRIKLGEAVWTDDFTPPTQPYT